MLEPTDKREYKGMYKETVSDGGSRKEIKKEDMLLLFDDYNIWGDVGIEDIKGELKQKEWDKVRIDVDDITVAIINGIKGFEYISCNNKIEKCLRKKYKAVIELTNTRGCTIHGKTLIVKCKQFKKE